MRTALPALAEKEAPLRALLDDCLRQTTKTCRVAARRAISTAEWVKIRAEAWQSVKDLVEHNVALRHRKPGRMVLVFPDASGLFWGRCVTQVPSGELEQDVPVKNMYHELLGLINGTFKGSQL